MPIAGMFVAIILPTLLSTGLLLKYWRQVKDQQIILGFLPFAVTMGLFMQYWRTVRNMLKPDTY